MADAKPMVAVDEEPVRDRVTARCVVLGLGLICFVPFALFVRGIGRSQQNRLPTQYTGQEGGIGS